MKKIFILFGLVSLAIKPTISIADHLKPDNKELKPLGKLAHSNFRNSILIGLDLSTANLSNANLWCQSK